MNALQGLRVLDLSPSRVGAQISQLFADFGAEVIWVEPPGGAELRQHPAYPFWARGKHSLELDITTTQGQAAVRDVAATADVLIETFRPGVLARHGLDFDTLAAINPRLVYTSVTGFGRQGPYSDLQGYEGLVAAKLGIFQTFSRIRTTGVPPFISSPYCTFSASQVALHGTLAALIERESSGLGQWVETSLAQSFITLDTWSWFEQVIDAKWPDAYKRVPNFDDEGIPNGAFPYLLLVALTSDGHWLQFAQVAPHLLVALMKALGLESVFTDPAWSGFPVFADAERRSAMYSLMLAAANSKTLAEWQKIFDTDPNVFAEVFRSGLDVLDHPQLVFDGMVEEIRDHERGLVRQPGPLVLLSNTPAQLGRAAPILNDAVTIAPVGFSIGESTDLATATNVASPSMPLEGVTILELAALFAAPNGPRLLTDLGARVIKVEPLAGDPIRMIIPFPEAGGASVMQGKDSICIDIGTTEGLALVHDLARSCDVVVQGFRAGVAERLGLGYQAIKALNPEVVYLNAPGYGNGGPNGHRAAYAPSIGAAVGIGRANLGDLIVERPGLTIDEIRTGARLLTVGSTTPAAQADGFAALGVATGMLLGLLANKRGAGGQEMLATMVNTGAHAMSAQIVQSSGCRAEPAPDLDLRGLSALYRIYDAADGWVFLAAPAAREWTALVGALSAYVDLGADPRFATAAARSTNDADLVEVLANVFATQGKDQWERDLRAADIGCVGVTTESTESVMWSDEFGRASGYITDVMHPVFEEHPRMNGFLRFSRSVTQAKPGVLAGSHTDAIMTELGFAPAAIADLRERNVIA